jgi:transposase
LFNYEVDPIPLSSDAAAWVDRIYNQIIRDDCFRNPQSVSHRPPASAQVPPTDLQKVFVDLIEHTHDAVLGPLLVAKAAWEQLDLSQCLRELGFTRKQITAAAASVMSRLVRPSSENALVQWIPTTAIPELLGDSVLDCDHKYFYRISDKLLKFQDDIERHLRYQSQRLFDLERTILLYDLTNTYFEGQAAQNPKARRGKSKEKRHDRPLVVLGMVYDGNGFALGHKTFDGNMNDGNSLVKMAQTLKDSRPVEPPPAQPQLQEKQVTPARTLVVVDAGVATAENLRLLRDAGFSYLVNDNRRNRRRYYAEFAKREAFTKLSGRFNQENKSQVDVRILQECPIDKDCKGEIEDQGSGTEHGLSDTILLCRSHGREEKESAMFSKAEEQFLAAVAKLDQRLRKGLLKQSKKVQQAIGRLKTQHPRVQRFYEIKLNDTSNSKVGLKCQRQDNEYDENKELFGCYVLRTDRQDFTPLELWRTYMSLTQAEEGFRALKTDLGLRPNYHQKEHRVDGHIFITVIAFHLWKWIRQKFDEHDERRDWVTVRRLLETHCYSTLIVPCEDGSVYHLRKPGRPERQQHEIYGKLGIDVNRLPKNKVKMKK